MPLTPSRRSHDTRRPDRTEKEPARADALITALMERNEDAFSALVRHYHHALIRTACRYVRSRQVAEEVVQDTWAGVIEGVDRYQFRSSFKTWLFGILIHKALSAGVRESRFANGVRPRPGPLVVDHRTGSVSSRAPQGSSCSFQDSPWTPEQWLSARELTRHLNAAFESLPKLQRQALRLRDLEGKSQRDICKCLRITETHLWVLLHRARRVIRHVASSYLRG